MSTRFVAAITLISSAELNPSIWFSSSNIVRCASRSPAFSESKRFVPMASSSSMKMMVGAFSLASANASRTSFAPSPMNICTSCGPASLRKVDFVWAAQARARSVLPVPGGPYSRTPFGGRMPRFLNFSRCVTGSTTASISSWICLSSPPMSEYCSVGRSSTSIAFTRASYSAGSVSRIRYESLLTPTRSAGFSFSASTNPISGRKTVWRVDVLMTAHLPLRCESSIFTAPSSSSSSSTSMSSSSITLDTRYGSVLLTLILDALSLMRSLCVRTSCFMRATSLIIALISISTILVRVSRSSVDIWSTSSLSVIPHSSHSALSSSVAAIIPVLVLHLICALATHV
uniref:Putative ribosomal protein s8 n=2 Tax=Anopheles triannulatus TaxID=58253 RepID=A0A2M4ACQ5_9DIPT